MKGRHPDNHEAHQARQWAFVRRENTFRLALMLVRLMAQRQGNSEIEVACEYVLAHANDDGIKDRLIALITEEEAAIAAQGERESQ